MTPILLERPGTAPLLAIFPQSGTGLPPDLAARMTPEALSLPDTCWHADRLWQSVLPDDVGWLMPAFSRLVIDLNRQPDPPVVPIPNATPLCATHTFGGAAVYRDDPPTAAEIAARIDRYWQPFHDRLRARLLPGMTLLDCHSIAPTETRFHGATPPPIAVKTGDGACCTPVVADRVAGLVARHGIDQAKGGMIIHRHARVAEDVSAVQIEIRQDLYMDPANPAAPLRPTPALAAFLRDVVTTLG